MLFTVAWVATVLVGAWTGKKAATLVVSAAARNQRK
jgi:hypothetical protein